MRRMGAAPQPHVETVELPVKSEETLQVSALRNGTVIDHLQHGTALRTMRLLALDLDATVLAGINLPSSKMGSKDLIKVEGRELTQEEIDKVALLSPEATLSIIRDFKVIRKIRPAIPDRIAGLIQCPNPSCITRDRRVETQFLTEGRTPLKLRCFFCERTFPQVEIEFL